MGSPVTDRLSHVTSSEGEGLKDQVRVCRCRHGHQPEVIDAESVHRTRANRTLWQHHRNRMGRARLDRPRSDPKDVEEEMGQSLDDQLGDHAVSDNVAQEKQRDEWGLIHKQLAVTKQSTV
jgi:hypothetical protein